MRAPSEAAYQGYLLDHLLVSRQSNTQAWRELIPSNKDKHVISKKQIWFCLLFELFFPYVIFCLRKTVGTVFDTITIKCF